MKNQYTWLHIGLGSFHRAHQAWYIHRLMDVDGGKWAISSGNIRNDAEDTVETLRSQGGQYILETVTPSGVRDYELIKSVNNLIQWQENLAPLVDEGAKPSTKVVSFTVTEGGYYLKTDHKLDVDNADLQADLNGGNKTIYGCITKILEKRIADNAGGVTLLNCDNLRHNGERFQDGLFEFLALSGKQTVLEWAKQNTTCPNTMVDRITPRPSEDLPQRVRENSGHDLKAPVMGETFVQWVIEDNFQAERPELEKVGVEFVESVVPHEEAKIRILNASHSCIAWAGTLVEQEFIHQSTLDPVINAIAYKYVTEDVIPCLGDNGIDLPKYRDVVLDRFTNPYIKDTNQRVAADGFSKIPSMVTPTMIECYKRGVSPEATAMLPALFFVFMEQWHKGQLPYEYQDGILDADSVHAMYETEDPISTYCNYSSLFGELAGRSNFESLLREKIHVVYALIK